VNWFSLFPFAVFALCLLFWVPSVLSHSLPSFLHVLFFPECRLPFCVSSRRRLPDDGCEANSVFISFTGGPSDAWRSLLVFVPGYVFLGYVFDWLNYFLSTWVCACVFSNACTNSKRWIYFCTDLLDLDFGFFSCFIPSYLFSCFSLCVRLCSWSSARVSSVSQTLLSMLLCCRQIFSWTNFHVLVVIRFDSSLLIPLLPD